MDATRLKKANPYTGNNSVKKREREKKKDGHTSAENPRATTKKHWQRS